METAVKVIKRAFLLVFFLCGACAASTEKIDHIEGKFEEFKNGRPTGKYLFLAFDITNEQGAAGHTGEQALFEMTGRKAVSFEGVSIIASGADLDSEYLRQIRWTPGRRLLCHYYPMGDHPMSFTAVKDLRTKKWIFRIEGLFRDGPGDAGQKWEFRSVPKLPIEDKSIAIDISGGTESR